MKFWDSSALVPLFVEEKASRGCRDIVRGDPDQAVWLFAVTEVLSALRRRHREGLLAAPALEAAEHRVGRVALRWFETELREPLIFRVRDEAARLMRSYPLRAADALQLGAALAASEFKPRGRAFVALDADLLAAARAEGFDAIEPGGLLRTPA